MATTVRLDAARVTAQALNRTALRRPLDDQQIDKLTRFIHRGGVGYTHFVHYHIVPQGEFCPCMQGACKAIRDMDKALRPKRDYPDARRALAKVARRYA